MLFKVILLCKSSLLSVLILRNMTKNNKATGSASKGQSGIRLDPSRIYFTNSKIRERFAHGKPIQETLDELIQGQITVDHIPKIRVIYDAVNDRYFSLNNRRLWVFKQLHQMGRLSEVEVELRTPTSRSEARFCANTLNLTAKVTMK